MSSDAGGAPSKRSRHWLAASGVALSALSFQLVLYTASEEPFSIFRWSDLTLIVGLGALVCVLFAVWAIACVRRFQRAARRRPRATVWVCATVLWTAINLFYLGDSMYAYVEDLRNPLFGPWR